MANHNRAPAIGACFVLALLLLLSSLAVAAQEQSSTPQQAAAGSAEAKPITASASNQAAPLPDSPGVLYSQNMIQDQTSNGQQNAQPAQNSLQEPAGTAAARTASPSGVAASEPAGSAIAPAKQRRVRTILISVGAVAAAGAALGAVAALSAGSPSRPPGAH